MKQDLWVYSLVYFALSWKHFPYQFLNSLIPDLCYEIFWNLLKYSSVFAMAIILMDEKIVAAWKFFVVGERMKVKVNRDRPFSGSINVMNALIIRGLVFFIYSLIDLLL